MYHTAALINQVLLNPKKYPHKPPYIRLRPYTLEEIRRNTMAEFAEVAGWMNEEKEGRQQTE
jgi:hypothetical protein